MSIHSDLSASGPPTGLHAVILAGGKGTRLHPFTVNFPKPLVPLGDVPVVEVLIRQLVKFGVTKVTMTLGHLSALMKAYFEQRVELREMVEIEFVEESQPTGTAGSIGAIQGLEQTFLVMNGDLLTDIDFLDLLRFHREQNAILTVASHQRRVKVDLGVLEIDTQHAITGYIEKPEHSYRVSMGIYVYEPEVLQYISKGEYLDLPTLVLKLIAAGKKVSAYPSDCLWLDIGRPDDYAKAQELFAASPESFERI
jgi:NDP-sugar pyrophosphorylase family protein